MKEHPILFSAPMVRAILEWRKTMTRRIVKPQPSAWIRGADCRFGLPYKLTTKKPAANRAIWQEDDGSCYEPISCPYGQPGDRLWVRETWQVTDWIHPSNDEWGYIYRADTENAEAWESSDSEWKWRPSIHMPRAASRILLEVVDVRVDRLQDISEADAIAEGVEQNSLSPLFWKHYEKNDWTLTQAKESFRSLWQSINGAESWEENPWVWVVEFKRINP